MTGTLYIARVIYPTNHRRWVLFDTDHTLTSNTTETRRAILARWKKTHGQAERAVRYKGTMRQSELAATIAELRTEEPR